MILEIEGKRVEVDDSFGKLSPDQQESQVSEIAKSFAPAAKAPAESDQANPLLPTLGGGLAAEMAAPGINAATRELSKGAAAKQLGVSPADLEWDSPGQRWARKTGFGAGEGKTVQEVDSAYKKMMAEQNAPLGRGKVSSRISGPMNLQSFEAAQAQEAARQAIFAEQRAKEAAALRAGAPMVSKAATALGVPGGIQAAGRAAYTGLNKAIPAVIGRGLAGAGAGFQGVDAYNRAQSGDYGGAAISGLGAIGSAAALIPHPIARVGGTALGIGAEALNAYLDSLKDKNKQGYADGGSVELKSQNSPIGVDIGSGTMGMQAGPYQIPHLAGGGRFGQNGPMTFGVRDIPDYPQEIPQKAKTGGEVKKKTHGPITKDELALIHRLRDHMAS